jgi:hypothetical protein
VALQFSTTVRNATLDSIEVDAGVSPVMRFFTGAPPANAAAANTGTEVANGTLPSDWMSAAAAGSKAKLGTWTLTGVAPGGTIGHFRLYRSDGTTVVMQGTVTITGGGGDMTVVNTSITASQPVTVDSFTLNAPNA